MACSKKDCCWVLVKQSSYLNHYSGGFLRKQTRLLGRGKKEGRLRQGYWWQRLPASSKCSMPLKFRYRPLRAGEDQLGCRSPWSQSSELCFTQRDRSQTEAA